MAALLFRLRPTGPWSTGTTGLFHSDTLYGAVTSAMHALGYREEWLAATATREQGSAVRFSSCFPFAQDTLYVTPPQTVWPPVTGRRGMADAKLVPVALVPSLLSGEVPDPEKWTLDPVSGALAAIGKNGVAAGPFRVANRTGVAVDRVSGAQVLPHQRSCLEFRPQAGWWCIAEFEDEAASGQWADRVMAAFRLLGDSGMGGNRTLGWGHFTVPLPREGSLPSLLLPQFTGESEPGYWLLSLFSPGPQDQIDWARGTYSLLTRQGRVESTAAWGARKQALRMVAEGSVLAAGTIPVGGAPDVAPPDHPHPVYQAGFAVTIPLPGRPQS